LKKNNPLSSNKIGAEGLFFSFDRLFSLYEDKNQCLYSSGGAELYSGFQKGTKIKMKAR